VATPVWNAWWASGCRADAGQGILYTFHQGADGRGLTPEEDAALSERGHARIRRESPGLQVLSVVSWDLHI
jgi:hypothetical protein